MYLTPVPTTYSMWALKTIQKQLLNFWTVFPLNRRTSTSRGKLFFRMIQQAVLIAPVCNKDIVDGITDDSGIECLQNDSV